MSFLRKITILLSIGLSLLLGGCAQIGKEASFFAEYEHQAIIKHASKTYAPLDGMNLELPSAYVMNFDTGDILLDINSDQSLPVASMSKTMTELLVLEAVGNGQLNWHDTVSISEYAYTISNTLGIDAIAFEADELYTVQELFDIMAIRSSNAASIALAEAVAGSERAFVQLMNERAKQLNLTNSHFVNSTGLTNHSIQQFDPIGDLDDSNHMSAKDVVTLANYLIEHHEELLEVTARPKVQFRDDEFGSTNLMLPQENDLFGIDVAFNGVDGFKTGFTDEAGYCFVGTTVINDARFISVVIGAESMPERFTKTKEIYEAIAKQNK